ncbi:MAG: MobA/MobL family protein [Eubacterium sp.]|nr:MobA/MobL family protein [Eubacterium sp.]
MKFFCRNMLLLHFMTPQILCNAIDRAEKRYDARTAREFRAALPNELDSSELKKIVREFIEKNFVAHNLCAIAAIHEGRNKDDPSKNNPHVHIIVPTRFVESEGFSRLKDREHDKKEYLFLWREKWAKVQNRAYERNHLPIRVSHYSLQVQGVDREPTKHLRLADYQKEKRGERTPAGDEKRKIETLNKEKALKKEREKEFKRNRNRSR